MWCPRPLLVHFGLQRLGPSPWILGKCLQLRCCLVGLRIGTKKEVTGYCGIFHFSVESKQGKSKRSQKEEHNPPCTILGMQRPGCAKYFLIKEVIV